MKRINAILFVFLTVVLAAGGAQAAGGHAKLDEPHLDVADKATLQRGAKYFVNYCMSCHSAAYSRFSRVGADLGLTESQVEENLILNGAKIGDLMTVSMTKEQSTAFFGVPAPDLSLVTRSRGADWVYTYLRAFYQDDSRPFGVNNLVFPSVSMPHVLMPLQGVQVMREAKHEEGGHGESHAEEAHHIPATSDLEIVEAGSLNPREYDRMVRDLVSFMVYLAEPAQTTRKALGFWVLGFLVLLFGVSYLMKREFWRDIH